MRSWGTRGASRFVSITKDIVELRYPIPSPSDLCGLCGSAVFPSSRGTKRTRRSMSTPNASFCDGVRSRARYATMCSEVLVEEIFEHLLAAGLRFRIQAGGEGVIGEIGEARFAGGDALTQAGVPAAVALLEQFLELAVVDRALGDEQATRQGVHAADVRVEQVFGIHALTAQLGVEIHAARTEPAALQDRVHHEADFGDVVRELVGVPTEQRVAAVHVDAAEEAVGDRVSHFVLEAVAGEDGVVGFDVDLVFLLQAVALEEGVHGGTVEVVLVLGRLFRLRLDQERALEADLGLVLGHQGQEAAELIALALHVGVEQGLVAFTPTPEHVILTLERERHVQRLAHLSGRVGEDFRIGIGGSATHVARVAEQVGGAPQELHARACHLALGASDQTVEVSVALLQGSALGSHVAIVEGVERRAELLEELEGDLQLQLRGLDRVLDLEPRPIEGTSPEHVTARPRERVPVADGAAEVLGHALAQDLLVLVVVLERKRVRAVFAFELDWSNALEEFSHDFTCSVFAI